MDFGRLFLHFLGDEFYLLVLRESLAQNMLMIVNALRLHRTEFKWGRGRGGGRGKGMFFQPLSPLIVLGQ